MSEFANTLFPPPPTRYKLCDGQTELQPPRGDWVEQEGRWLCFGETYEVGSYSACPRSIPAEV